MTIAYFQNLDIFEDDGNGIALAIEDEVVYLDWEEVRALGGLLIQLGSNQGVEN